MKLLRNAIIASLIIVFIIGALVCLYLEIFLEWALREAIGYASTQLAGHGIELRDPNFTSVRISLPWGVAIYGLSAYFAITQHNVFQMNRSFFFTADRISISIGSLRKKIFIFTMKNVSIRLQPEYGTSEIDAKKFGKEHDYDRMDIAELRVPITLDFLNRRVLPKQGRLLIKEIASLARLGTTSLPMQMTGTSAFSVRNKPVSGKVFMEPYKGQYRLVMDERDFRAISSSLGERLTDAELRTYCSNPLRLPRMLKIRDYASDQAYHTSELAPDIPAEVYKHVLWSYLLAKAYDDEFSAEVTDAHEAGSLGSEHEVRTYLARDRGIAASKLPVGQENDASSRMDLRNNAVGRDYARKGYSEKSILERIARDPRIVKDPSDL